MEAGSSTTALRVCVSVYLFTGKERDAETGLDYFGARYYRSNMGRFMSPDDGSGNIVHENVPQGGNLLATYSASTSKWLYAFNDWLGTKRAQVGPDGSTSFLGFTSLPYGDNLSMSGVSATEDHFTGKDRDQESGNDYFGARYYSSRVGRWMSPDWSAQEEPVPYAKLDDPQSLNLYS